MASAIIHICVAKVANQILNKDNKDFILGSIAPDIAKQVGKTKKGSHFITEVDSDLPNLDLFLSKYKDTLDNSFNLGYYCHLFTDLLWYGFYVERYQKGNNIYFKDGHSEEHTITSGMKIIYQEYTNLNIKLIDKYHLDLSLFYEDTPIINSDIKEIPVTSIKKIIDSMGIIIENSENKDNQVFDIDSIVEFINFAADAFIKNLKEKEII